MKRPATHLAAELCPVASAAIIDKLESDGVQVLALSLDGHHLHLLAKFVGEQPRHWVGRAKKHASHVLRRQGLRTGKGGL